MAVAARSGAAKKAQIGPVLSNASKKLQETFKKDIVKGIMIIHTRGMKAETSIAEESCDRSLCDPLISMVSLSCMSCPLSV
jgi:hypothetical protein